MHIRTFGINSKIGYKEYDIDGDIINKIYEINNQGCEEIVSIPDGCIDIEFLYKDGNISTMLCGSHVEGMISEVGNYDYCFGIKFNPGARPNVITGKVADIINQRIEIQAFDHIDEIQTQLFKNSSFESKIDYFVNYFEPKNLKNNLKNQQEINITTYVISQIEKHCGAVNIAQLVDDIGYSQCYINRVFKEDMGISIKKYADIIRMQESLKLLRKEKETEIYEKLGYYDQAHFIKAFKKFTTLTPKRYKESKAAISFV